MDRNQGVRWIPIEDWLSRRQAQERPGVPIGLATPAARNEILALRRKKSGPGVSHHSNAMPRHQRTA